MISTHYHVLIRKCLNVKSDKIERKKNIKKNGQLKNLPNGKNTVKWTRQPTSLFGLDCIAEPLAAAQSKSSL